MPKDWSRCARVISPCQTRATSAFLRPTSPTLHAGKDIFSSAAVMQGVSLNFSRENATPICFTAAQVWSGYFRRLSGQAPTGPAFTPEEDQPGAEHEVVLSHRAWTAKFGSDPNIVGAFPDAEPATVSRCRRHGGRVQLAKPGGSMGPPRTAAGRYHDHEVPLQRESVRLGAASSRRHLAASQCLS